MNKLFCFPYCPQQSVHPSPELAAGWLTEATSHPAQLTKIILMGASILWNLENFIDIQQQQRSGLISLGEVGYMDQARL